MSHGALRVRHEDYTESVRLESLRFRQVELARVLRGSRALEACYIKHKMKTTEAIKVTNLGPCYGRSFSDIPLSKELAELVDAKRAVKMFLENNIQTEFLAAMMEGRYKSIDELIKRNNIKQIIEIAAGWAPRGMNMTVDPNINYIETDQDAEEIKEKISIQKKLPRTYHPNLHSVLFNAITGEGIRDIVEILKPGKVCIVHEGLFRYFSHEQKSRTIGFIVDILKKHGGVYITPDIHTRKLTTNLNKVVSMNEMNKKHSELTRTDIDSNEFTDIPEAEKLFESFGFKIKKYKWGDLVKDFSCLKDISLDKQKLIDAIEVISQREIWEMRLE